jgi:hypothetical protein
MKTLLGRDIAIKRHEFMVQFMKTFEEEVGLKSFLETVH